MDIVTLAAAKKAARSFGASSAGKAAVVGADGMLTAQEIAAGEIVVDTTLAISGAAADAAATGAAIASVNTAATNLGTSIGNLSNLTTTAKSNLVAAINEVAQSGGGGGGGSQVTVITPGTGSTFTLDPCPVTYSFGERAELTLTLTTTTQYHFMFVCPSSAATVLTMSGITKTGDTLAAGKTYEVDVWAGIARISEVVAQ